MMEISEALVAQQQVIRLQALLEASRQLHSTIELDAVLRIALEIVVRELELDGAFFTSFAQTYGDVRRDVQAALSKGAPQRSDEDWLPSHLGFPLYDKAGVPFTELIVLLPPERVLDLDETDFLESLAVQASVAIENARFHRRALEWHRVEGDLTAARQVQQSLIPQSMPAIANYGLAGRSMTCYEVGGDYMDCVEMPSGQTMIVVADVAGKGLASALIGASFRSAVRGMAHAGLSVYEIATKMNLLHYGEGEEARHRYVTAIFMCLDPTMHTLQLVNAGHNPALLLSPRDELTRIKASGTPVGMLPFSTYATQTFVFEPGSRLLVYTDGLTEVFQGEEEFGEARLLEAFRELARMEPDRVLHTLWERLEAFSGGGAQSDDMTALVLTRNA
jgi:serine phosphatase RsbU (regulator of sigma subunit)